VRRGHVTIACSQALLPFFLPQQIAAYRNAHPGVTFAVNVRDREQAEAELVSFRSDLALVFEPRVLVDFEVLHAIPQPVCALFARDHPLAGRSELRLRDCLDHPHIAPAQKYGVRGLLDMAAKRVGRTVTPVVETESFELIRYYVMQERAVGFQIPIGLSSERIPGWCSGRFRIGTCHRETCFSVRCAGGFFPLPRRALPIRSLSLLRTCRMPEAAHGSNG
jgi:DNA-binding transcriptional LysR family regulator